MTLEPWQLAVLTGLGTLAGWVNVMAGGGSVLTVPVMVFMGLPGPVANGTNRISIIAQNIVAIWGFFSKGLSEFRLSASLAAFAAVGAGFGASFGVTLDGAWFNRVLAGVIILILMTMLADQKRGPPRKPDAPQRGIGSELPSAPKNIVLGHILMIGAGFWGGFIQIGVGFLLMPILYRVMGIDLVRTNMHKVFIALVFSIVALIIFAARTDIAWDAGFALAAGNAVGGYLGARTAMAKGEGWIKAVLVFAMVGLIIKLVFFP
ncbi:MAG: sulfite exporter TauE/SafE family protein [Pseudomonadota bacterium]